MANELGWTKLGWLPPRNELRHFVLNGYHVGLPEDLGDLILKEHKELDRLGKLAQGEERVSPST